MNTFYFINMKVLMFIKSMLFFVCFASCTHTDESVYDTPTSRLNSDSDLTNKNETQTMKIQAFMFAKKIIELGNVELGTANVKEIIDTLDLQLSFDEDIKQVKRISNKVGNKVKSYLSALGRSVSLIENFSMHSKKLTFVHVPCIYISENGSYEEPYNVSTIDSNNLPLTILNLTEGFTLNAENGLGVNNHVQYFISEMETERPTHVFSDQLKTDKCIIMDDPHFQRVFFKTISNKTKNVVLLMDHGVSLSDNQFANAKSLAKHIVCSLSEEDKVSLFAVSDCVISAVSTSSQHCDNITMLPATDYNKHHFNAFIDDLNKTKGPTNHSLAFSIAFETIKQSLKEEKDEVAVVVYISRGLLTSIMEVKTVMEVISLGQDSVVPTVIINTCVLIDDGKTILYEKHFLGAVAQQNFSMYDIDNRKSEAGGIIKGTMMSVNSSCNMGAVVRTVLSTPLQKLKTLPSFFLPHWDVIKKGELVVSISQAAKDKDGNLLGVLGIDVPLEDLAEDFLYFNTQRHSYYMFLTTISGKAIAHPLLKEPSAALYEQPLSLDITHFETCPEFVKIRPTIYQNLSGVWKHERQSEADRGMTYSWKHVADSPYVVIGVSVRSPRRVAWPVPSSVMPVGTKLAYHRLDYNPSNYNLCRNFRQLSSLDTGSLFLSGWCFQSPYKYLTWEQNVSQLNVQSYMAYLKDTTNLLANPGLRSNIRDQVVSIVSIIPYWKKLYFESTISKYIVRKYIVTSGGAVVMYPGGVLDHKLDILRRSWYLRASSSPELVTLSPPYLDAAGAGYVVTLSIAFGQEPLSFVLAIDFSPGAMFHFLVESMPMCWSTLETDSANVKCFLMDDRGYLIAHPNLFEPLIKTTADEQYHIMHRESLLANDLLNHKGLVTKLVCNDFASNTVQRFYQFNLSLDYVVTNKIAGEQCVRYQLTQLAGTNTFLGIVNTSCDLTAFCPCPTTDRQCLNCRRMEQNECECPCECPLDPGLCDSENFTIPSNPPCLSTAEPTTLHLSDTVHSLLPTLKPCHHHDCDRLPTHQSCLGVVGCEWCQLQADGITRLPTPFCTFQPFCFNGVLGSNSETTRRPNSQLEGSGSPLPIGSMGCALFVLLGALFLMSYCYCRHSQRRTTYMAPDSSFHMLTMDRTHIIEEPPTGVNTDLVSNAQELSVALLSPAAGSISPYRMSSNYRRPPTGDSDHGYSTMTPHEDTEPVSNHSPRASPLPLPPPGHTSLSPHHIIAPVTVHMAMDMES